MPDSLSVGTPSRNGVRVEPAVAMIRTRCARCCSIASPTGENMHGIWPPATSVTARAEPRYGTWAIGTPRARAVATPMKCGIVPAPGEP
jgi:hypothetical protein